MQKKLLAVLCAVAIVLTSLCGALIAVAANSGTDVPTATIGGLTSMVNGGGAYYNSYEEIDSLTALNTAKSVSVTPVNRPMEKGSDAAKSLVVNFNYAEGVLKSTVEGYLLYVDVSANTDATAPVNMSVKIYQNENAVGPISAGVFGWNSFAS